MHYLGICKHTKRINLCVWCKTKTLCILTSNNSRNKCPMAKIVIQCILIGPICALLNITHYDVEETKLKYVLKNVNTYNSQFSNNEKEKKIGIFSHQNYLNITKMWVICSNASVKYSHFDFSASVPFRPKHICSKQGSNLRFLQESNGSNTLQSAGKR